MITFLLHAFFSTGFAYFFSWIFDGLTPTIAVVSLLLGTWIARRRFKDLITRAPGLRFFAFEKGESGFIELLLTISISYVAFRHFAWLFFYMDGRFLTLHANNFGDLPLHINYIRQMANGVSFPPLNPSFASEVLRYPFGVDLYSAMWEISGVPMQTHLFLVGLAGSLTALSVLRWFGGWWAIGAFFLSGGVVGWSVLQGVPLTTDLTQGIEWKNLFLAVFITQRGVLFALPMSLILIEMTRRHFSGEAPLTKTLMTTLGLCWGLLPLMHAHAFVITSLMMAGVAAISSVKNIPKLLFSRMAIFAYLPATYFVLRSTDGLGKAAIIRWDSWWTSDFSQMPDFLLVNFGPWLVAPLAVLATLLLSKQITPQVRRARLLELALYVSLFILFFNVMLAPWAWDNIKILIFPYLGIARLLWVTFDPILPKYTRAPIAILLFLSGSLALLFSIGPPAVRGVNIYDAAQLGTAEGAVRGISKEAVFASAGGHDHPLTALGRLRAVGYEGHLWSHGIDYKSNAEKLRKLMTGDAEPLKLARELGVSHIFWGTNETAQFGAQPTWPASFKQVSNVGGVSVYEVH